MTQADAGGYPGNPSLPREVREKILSTFRHTLNLFRNGKLDDCLIGCDFILKMDPRFVPARQLLEKSRNPAADVDIDELERIVAETPTRQERVAAAEPGRLLVRAAESLNARDFDAAIAAAGQVLEVLPGNQEAQAILDKASQRKQSQPQFEVARQRALAALDGNQFGEARAALGKMRSLDAEHPAVTLLERRLAEPAAAVAAAAAAGFDGDSTNPGLEPRRPSPSPEPAEYSEGGLDELSLDSLSLDEPLASAAVVPPPPDLGGGRGGPLGGEAPTPGSPADLWGEPSADLSEPAYEPAPPPPPAPPPRLAPEPPSPQQEIASLLVRGDEAGRAGNRQQAIELWSRIFLLDINNSDAVGRIEKARQEMAEGNRRVSEALRRGREAFEGGDFTGAREAFLGVLAIDENEQTARSYIDRIEHELARPSSSHDLARKAPAGDILAEEMAQAGAAESASTLEDAELGEPLEGEEEPRAKAKAKGRAIRLPRSPKTLAALAGVLLALGITAYFATRSRGPEAAATPAGSGPTLEHATTLFREGKLAETIAELKRIGPQHPDYARAQKLLASLSRGAPSEAVPPAPGGAPAEKPISAEGPASEAARLRAAGEKALAEKRYIEALKSFNLAASSYENDPTFAQDLGAASERVAELTPAVKLYNDGEYETAIPILWRLFQADRDNQDARSYLVRCYYNQGITLLQNGLYPKAAESFQEILVIDSGDLDALRHKKFAERYLKSDLDLMGRIYVRHLQQRP